MNPLVEKYNYSLHKEKNYFVALCIEWPSLSAHGDTPEKALAELKSIVSFCLEDLRPGEKAPVPIPKR